MGRAKQKHLEGMEPPSIPCLDDAADHYYEWMQKRQKALSEEKDAKLNVLSIMAEEGLERYETPDGLVVTVLSNQKASIKKKDTDSGESNEDDD